jgi:hypothetical protein
LPPTQSAQPPYQAALNFQPGQLISRQPSQSSQSIPSTNENTGNNNINYFSGGIRILNNRMVVPTPQAPAKEPVLKWFKLQLHIPFVGILKFIALLLMPLDKCCKS